MPLGQLPVLEITKGSVKTTLTQSTTIARGLARKAGSLSKTAKIFNFNASFIGLVGSSDLESAKCDEIAGCLNDLFDMMFQAMFESDTDVKEKMMTKLKKEEFPRILGYFEKIIQENTSGHLVGNNVSDSLRSLISVFQYFV